MKNKDIKRDRVIFISLVDILLQLIFVLLIVVLFVYREYDSMVIKLSNSSNCEAQKNRCDIDLMSCTQKKDQCSKELGDFIIHNLQACIPISKTNTLKSINFTQRSINEIIFEGFTDAYFKYLNENKLNDKIIMAKSIKQGTIFKISNIDKYFGFVREIDCYHDFSIKPIPSMNSVDASYVYGRLASVLKTLQN